jgi:hypothetical protein
MERIQNKLAWGLVGALSLLLVAALPVAAFAAVVLRPPRIALSGD